MAKDGVEVKIFGDDSDFKNTLNRLGSVSKAALTGMAASIAAAGAAIVKIGAEAITAYSNYEQLVGGVETLFGAGGKSLEEFAESIGKTTDEARDEYDKLIQSQEIVIEKAKNAYETAGMSANDYMETVTSFSASLLQSLGGDTMKAADYADRAIVDMSDNANKMGTDIQMIQNAYQGFAKQNYTMLDNLKLGYGGTQEEMKRLISDASKMTDVQKKLGITVDASSMSFGNIVNAISVMQKSMGIAGTTAKEAATTIQGSLNMTKAAWENLMTGLTDPEQDLDALIDNFLTSLTTFTENLIPRLENILSGVVDVLATLLPEIIDAILDILPSLLPKLLEGGYEIIKALAQGIIENTPKLLAAIGDFLSGAVLSFSEYGYQNDALTESINKTAEAQKTACAAIEENTIQQLAQVESARMLFDELQTLADETGHVDEADRARAEYIIGELNSALGLEIEMNNGVVSSLDDIANSIDEVIQKKQAQILLSAQEEKYADAVKNIGVALDEEKEAYNRLADAQAELRDLQEKAAAAERGEFTEWTSDMAVRKNELETYYIDEYQKAFDTASQTVAAYSANMKLYEDAASAAVEGNNDKVIDLLTTRGTMFKTAADVAGKSAEEQKQAMGQQLIEAVNAIAVAETNLKKVNSEDNKKRLEEAKTHAAACFEQYKAVGGNMVDGIITGINGKKVQLEAAMIKMLQDTEAAAKKEAKIQSPSKKYRDEVGKMLVLGLANGIKENAKTATESFKTLLEQLDFQRDLDIVSEDEYYEKLENLRDSYLTKGTKEWYSYTVKIYEYQQKLIKDSQKAFENAKKDFEKGYDDFIQSVEKKVGDLLKNQQKLAGKLSDYGGLYDTDAVIGVEYEWSEDGKTLTEKEVKGLKPNNLKEQTAEIKKFSDNLLALKERADIPQEFFATLRDLSVEDGIKFTDALLNFDDETLNQYISDWKEKQEAANKISKQLYADEYEEVKKEIEDEFGTLPEKFMEIGKDSGSEFIEGFKTTVTEKLDEARLFIENQLQSIMPTAAYAGASGGVYNSTNYTTTYVLQPAKGESTTAQLRTIRNAETLNKLRNKGE